MIDHDALSAMIRRRRKVGAGGLLPELPAAYLDLHDEVKRLRAERDRFETALGRACQVGGTTYLVERAEKAEAERDALRAYLRHVIDERDATFALMLARAEKAEAERERLLYVLDGVAGAIDTGRNEPLQVWRDQINIARQALKGQTDEEPSAD